ncbi:MAG: hypothetical protein KJ838_03040 [Candidatus Omnitrophica bacterium]|nr:hypothetical protein [Candidatus Omnitrophota bacterium]
MIYLFVGEDEFSKDIKLQKIKEELFPPRLESFNFETLYSKDLDLITLQEKLLLLPVKAKQRLILIKGAPKLNAEIKKYLLSYFKNPLSHVSIIFEARHIDRRDTFFSGISKSGEQINFSESVEINAFTLARQILQKRISPALRLLRQLLLKGERPEKILGAIRYQLHRERLSSQDKKRKLSFLLNCDIDIKTGRLKPEFALERLFIRLCYS